MSHTVAQVARWSTRSYGEPADTTPMDLAALRAHLVLCRRPQSRAFRLRCAARDLGAFMLSHVISTLPWRRAFWACSREPAACRFHRVCRRTGMKPN